MELKSIGYSDVTIYKDTIFEFVLINHNLLQTTGLLGSKTQAQEADEVVSQLPRPDFSQMIPYKPKATTFPGEHPLAGGTFPQPPALAALCSQLPPPNCFRGPFVAIDLMIDIFNRIQLPEGLFSRLWENATFSIYFYFCSTCSHW